MKLRARKRRKRTNKKVPAKGVLEGMANKLWRLAVLADWNNRCAVCGRGHDVQLDPHHLIPRQYPKLKYDLEHNGICLCSWHHVRDPEVAPHKNAGGWMMWLDGHHPRLAGWYRSQLATKDYQRFEGRVTWVWYVEIIRDLKQYVEETDWDRIVGVRFGQWLNEQESGGET